MELLKVEHISKSYAQHRALSNVSLSIPKGAIFGLLGPNGAGKTTLIRIITQIIEQDKGDVFLSGQRMTPELVRNIGYLPEERGLYKKMKVGEQLIYLSQLKGLSKSEAKSRIKPWLERLDLLAWSDKNIEDLSKGMAQKVQFIATVVHQPELIILDEPFSGFDPVNADLIKDEILRLRDEGTTVIFSTHRMESVEELCDQIALINKSEKILDGPKVEIKNEHKDGTFEVTHEGLLVADDYFEILSTQTLESGLQQTVVKDFTDGGPNNLLKALIGKVEIHGFAERIPSINDIFISKVTTEHHG